MKTRTIRCFPSEENEILERMHLLGYKLTQRNEIDNVREVYDGSVSVTRGNYTGTDVYTHTERNHYLSLLFEKDIDDQDLDDKLSALEKEVDKTVDILDKNYDATYNLTQKLKKQKNKTHILNNSDGCWFITNRFWFCYGCNVSNHSHKYRNIFGYGHCYHCNRHSFLTYGIESKENLATRN